MPHTSIRNRYRAATIFEGGIRPPYWEFGYWIGTMERWYREGLKRSSWSLPPGLNPGDVVWGEATPFPYGPGVLRYRDWDVNHLLGFDPGSVRIPINWRCAPQFAEEILEEDEDTRRMINLDGVTVRVKKTADSLPQFLKWPVTDRESWEQVKEERFGADIMTRFPDRWMEIMGTYVDRDYPLGVFMGGLFSTPRELLGVERQLMMYYDDPTLMHEINVHLTDTYLAVLEQLVSQVDMDFVYVWEDMSYKNGPLISPRMFKTFLSPYYSRITGFLRAHGIHTICVDTDGDCRLLIPLFLEAGVNGLMPFECQAGMNVVEIRKEYPDLLIMGGINKNLVAESKAAIDTELDSKLPFMLRHGGYIPFCDHHVPPNVPWENFVYYRHKLQDHVERWLDQGGPVDRC